MLQEQPDFKTLEQEIWVATAAAVPVRAGVLTADEAGATMW
ncbi:MAG: hypothetical protein QME77_07885 [bacterium]|nr:hypothetical protein [bacterium]